MDKKQPFHSFSVPMDWDLRGILSMKPYVSIETDKKKPFKDICMRTTSSLILGPSKLRTSEGTGAHHRESDAIRAAEAALMLSSRTIDDDRSAII